MVTIQLKFCKTETRYLMVSACQKPTKKPSGVLFYSGLLKKYISYLLKKKGTKQYTKLFSPKCHTFANV